MLTQTRRNCALACLACAALLATPLVARRFSLLTQKDIDEAIEWGMQGDPAPYLLHHEGHPGRINTVIVGVIYTPFLRVALAAKAARNAGRTFAPSDVTPKLVEPVIYVAFRWYCCVDPDYGTDRATWDPSKPPLDYKIAVPGDGVLRGKPRLRVTGWPLWIGRDLSLLSSFGGGDLPYPDVVLIAGYPIDVLSASPDFVIYRKLASPPWPMESTGIEVGRVTAEDLKHWR